VQPIDLDPRDFADLLRILAVYAPQCEVRAFGSRVSGPAKPHSDLDLALVGKEPIPSDVLADLRDTLRESDLPFRVDVIDWATTSDNFRRIIEQNYVVLQQAAP